jgi:hypothetical protein
MVAGMIWLGVMRMYGCRWLLLHCIRVPNDGL